MYLRSNNTSPRDLRRLNTAVPSMDHRLLVGAACALEDARDLYDV